MRISINNLKQAHYLEDSLGQLMVPLFLQQLEKLGTIS